MSESETTENGQAAIDAPGPRWLGLFGWVFVCFLAFAFGGRFRPGDWYLTLAKPFFTPPSWVFAPVWAVLYSLIAVGAWMVWRPNGFRGSARLPLILFLIQLVMNAAWSWLFFGKQRMDWALIDIIALFVLLIGLIVLFHREDEKAAWFLMPYTGWIAFASLLNLAFFRMNG